MVFKKKSKVIKSAIQYIVLAITILALNTLLLTTLVKVIGLNEFLSKILVEIALFKFNWIIQKKVIFKAKGEKRKHVQKTYLYGNL